MMSISTFRRLPIASFSRCHDKAGMRTSIAMAVIMLTATAQQPALSRDMPVGATRAAVPFSWTGSYLGVSLGYASGRSDVSSAYSCPSPGNCFFNFPNNLAAFSAAGTGPIGSGGFVGGAVIGHNWQTDALVFGLEADLNAFHLSGVSTRTTGIPTAPGQTFTATTGIESNWLFTARGRLGWAVVPMVIIYTTGGLALTDIKVSNFSTETSYGAGLVTGSSNRRGTKYGWTVGAGTEWAANANWSFKAEYLYADFGAVTTNLAIPNAVLPGGAVAGNAMATTGDLCTHIVRIGASYRFGAR